MVDTKTVLAIAITCIFLIALFEPAQAGMLSKVKKAGKAVVKAVKPNDKPAAKTTNTAGSANPSQYPVGNTPSINPPANPNKPVLQSPEELLTKSKEINIFAFKDDTGYRVTYQTEECKRNWKTLWTKKKCDDVAKPVKAILKYAEVEYANKDIISCAALVVLPNGEKSKILNYAYDSRYRKFGCSERNLYVHVDENEQIQSMLLVPDDIKSGEFEAALKANTELSHVQPKDVRPQQYRDTYPLITSPKAGIVPLIGETTRVIIVLLGPYLDEKDWKNLDADTFNTYHLTSSLK